MASETQAPFLALHPFLDFLNTEFTPDGVPTECIGDGAAWLAWLVQAELITGAAAAKLKRQHDAEALDAMALQARKLRGWAARWIEQWTAAPDADYEAERKRVNGWLARGSTYSELAPSADGLRLVEHSRLETADELVAMLAGQLARLVSAESPELIRRCAGTGCTLWFLDRTKAHRRQFCSAAVCGNRAKVAAFRARQRVEAD